jgi:hypothetical protein
MSLPPGSDFFNFEDFFGPAPASPTNGQETLYFAVLDRLVVTEDPRMGSVILVMRDSTHLQKPGVGCSLTVAQATQVILLIQKSIAKVEGTPMPPSEEDGPRFTIEGEPYD